MIDRLSDHETIHRWWFNYDEGRFDLLEELLTDDVEFTSRTDSGTHPFEDFIRSEQSGRADVMAWHWSSG